MRSGLADKVAVVTGASGGIGRALAEVFAEEGARLVLLAHSRLDALREWAGERGLEERALCLGADVSRSDELGRAFDEARERFGRLDVCVANAGVWPPEDAPLHELDEERFERTVATNLLGAAWTARHFARALAATGPREDGHGAALTFIGSTAGRFGERNHCDYAASKAGLVGLVHSLKNELPLVDPYARVNLVEPGWTVTEMARPALDDPANIERVVRTMALRQLGRAVDVARTVAFLSSPLLARHLTGQVVTAAGGMEGRLLWERAEVDVPEIRARLARE